VGDEHLGNVVDVRDGHYVDDAAGLADRSGQIADEDLQALVHGSSSPGSLTASTASSWLSSLTAGGRSPPAVTAPPTSVMVRRGGRRN
jgi:hypothetical protein